MGDKVDLAANFSASNKKRASLQSDVSGTWAKVSGFTGKVLNSYGNYTFKGLTLTQPQRVRVMVDSGSSPEVTEVVQLDP